MEKQEYVVQRKYIGWETCSVEATSFDEAVELAEEKDSWDDALDAYQTTEDYWVHNLDTKVVQTRMEGETWEESI